MDQGESLTVWENFFQKKEFFPILVLVARVEFSETPFPEKPSVKRLNNPPAATGGFV
jgi:hypothetical protein